MDISQAVKNAVNKFNAQSGNFTIATAELPDQEVPTGKKAKRRAIVLSRNSAKL